MDGDGWAGSPMGVRGLWGASGHPARYGTLFLGHSQLWLWGHLPLARHCPSLPVTVSPTKPFWGWGSLSQAGTPPAREEPCGKGAQANFHGLTDFSG